MPLLYDAIAAGMWAFRTAAFRVTTLGAENPEFAPGTLLVATHRRETDVPVLCPSIYAATAMWRERGRRLCFAVRDDMFAPGFLAGIPGLPLAARRRLYPVDVVAMMEERLLVYPLRSATEARLGDVLRAAPEEPLASLAPAEVVERFERRARSVGLQPPAQAGDVLRGEFGDLLWMPVQRTRDAGEALGVFWERRAGAAVRDLRKLVSLLRGGARLLVFPEGYPSATGEIGPLRRGLGALVRRGRPAAVQPIALAYDPVTPGRTRAYVAFGRALTAPADDVEAHVTTALRRTMPLTVGQVVASRVRDGGRATEEDLARAVEEARREGRPLEAALLDDKTRRRRLEEALRVASRADLAYVAREHASARS